MAKRIYCAKNKRLFQFQPDGNFYARAGGTELCLETNDLETAEANLKYQDALTTRYGVASFKFKVRDLFPKFLEEKRRTLRESTHRSYVKLWEGYMRGAIGKLYLADLNQRAWERYCSTHDSVTDFQNHKNLVVGFMKWCAKKGHLHSLPVLENPEHKRRRRKIIPPQHLNLIFRRAQGSLRLFCSMALFMGMRRSEIMKLEWPRVDLDHRSITLRDEDVKTDEGRQIPITAAVYKLLVERLREQQESGLQSKWVFPNASAPRRHADVGGLMTAWRRCLLHCGLAERVNVEGKKVKYKIVVEYTWHDLRATYEKYSHTAQEFSDTQREKMVGADIEVQRRIYVSLGADDLRGMEEVVTNQLPELSQILDEKTVDQKDQAGKRVGNNVLKIVGKGGSNEDA